MRVIAVTFDASGTLLDLRESVGAVYGQAARAHGARVTDEELEAAFQALFPAMPPLAFGDMPQQERARRERQWWQQLVERVCRRAGAEIRDFDAFFNEVYEQFRDAGGWRLFPDVRPVLGALREAGYRLGLVTNFDSRIQDVLEALELAPLLDRVITSSRAGAAKPDPGIFQAAVEALGTTPQETLHVGDSLEADWHGAREAGLQALLLDRDGRHARRQGVQTVASLEGILQILGLPAGDGT